jgi:hypothetical protein
MIMKPSRSYNSMIAREDAQATENNLRLLLRNTCLAGQLTQMRRAFEHEGMSLTLQASPRRSTRVFHKMRVHAKGRGYRGKKFTETCETLVVNAHGGLLMLKQEVNHGEMLVLIHPETLEEQECRIVYLGEPADKGQRVAVEFLTPAPHFWGLDLGESPVSGTEESSSLH